MKQDEVLQTLRKVIAESDNFTTWTVSTPHLVELVRRAVAAEREECARACENIYEGDEACGDWPSPEQCAEAIRVRGQPEERNFCSRCGKRTADLTTIHTCTPPQRQWVGLTDDELADLWYKESLDWMEFARAHEDKLKEKNT